MKIWLPYTIGGSGSDVFVRTIADGLRRRGIEAVEQSFPHQLQYAPWLLRAVSPPEGTDIALCNSWNGFAFKRRGLKLITVEHLFVLDKALRPYKSFAQRIFHQSLVRHYERASLLASDVQVAVSEYTANAHHRVLKGKKPRVIPNGVDTEFFCPPHPSKAVLASRNVRLLFVGNLTRRKGIDLLPTIMRALGNRYELEYAVGLRTTDSLASLPNAKALGRLDRDDVRDAYRRADLLLFPTRLEGLPLSAIEAMACGTPVVASRTSSLPEVIEHGATGYLCQQDDADAFAAAIRRFAQNPQEIARMGAAARAAAVTKFNLSRMLDDYVCLFRSILENSSAC